MVRYRQINELLRRPLSAVLFLVGLFLLVEAIWLERGAPAHMTAASVIGGSVISWLLPSGRRAHSPSESTLQWARKQRRTRG